MNFSIWYKSPNRLFFVSWTTWKMLFDVPSKKPVETNNLLYWYERQLRYRDDNETYRGENSAVATEFEITERILSNLASIYCARDGLHPVYSQILLERVCPIPLRRWYRSRDAGEGTKLKPLTELDCTYFSISEWIAFS